jgi:hypothetical protein
MKMTLLTGAAFGLQTLHGGSVAYPCHTGHPDHARRLVWLEFIHREL